LLRVLAEDVEWLPLHTERLSLIVGRGHPAANGDRKMNVAALAAEPLALLRAWPEIIESTFERVKYRFTTEHLHHMLWW